MALHTLLMRLCDMHRKAGADLSSAITCRPSGSGKSTLLDLLSGRKTVGSMTGEIKIAGTVPTRSFLRRFTGYVEQSGGSPVMYLSRRTALHCHNSSLFLKLNGVLSFDWADVRVAAASDGCSWGPLRGHARPVHKEKKGNHLRLACWLWCNGKPHKDCCDGP